MSGEILAGLLLGPSLLGAFFRDFMHALFHPSTGTIFTGLAQVGLVFLMFQIGLEFEFNRHLGGDRRPIVVISLLGLVLPFAMGYLSAPWFHARLSEPVPLFGFRLFFAVAISLADEGTGASRPRAGRAVGRAQLKLRRLCGACS